MISNSQYIMKYDTFNGNDTKSIKDYISTVKYLENDINHISFDNMVSVFKDYTNLYMASDKDFETLITDKIDGIKYYQDKDILTVPGTVYTIMDADASINYQGIMSYYNLKEDNKWGYKVPSSISETFPSVKASKLASVEKKYESDINLSVLFNNLPQSLYNNVIIEEQGIMYDIDKKEYFTPNMNQEELFKRIESIAINGFERPLEMLITSEGLIPYSMSREDFLIGIYLDLPSIPVAFISSSVSNRYPIKRILNREETGYPSAFIKHIDNNYNKEELQTILEPYFIIN